MYGAGNGRKPSELSSQSSDFSPWLSTSMVITPSAKAVCYWKWPRGGTLWPKVGEVSTGSFVDFREVCLWSLRVWKLRIAYPMEPSSTFRGMCTPVKTSANSWEIRSLTRAPPFSLFPFRSKGGGGRKIFFQDIHQDLTHLHFQVENCPNDDANLKKKLQVFDFQGKFRK